ncbi:TPA: rhs family protein [Yersinia enterocolitica]|nr:rhs family protein [Yersinia enterocolitica]
MNIMNFYNSHMTNYDKEGFDKGLVVEQYKDSSGNKAKDHLDINGKLIWRKTVLKDKSEAISYFDRNAQGSIINRYDQIRNAKGEVVKSYELTRTGSGDSTVTVKMTREFRGRNIITNSESYTGKGKGTISGYTRSSDKVNRDGKIIHNEMSKFDADNKLINTTIMRYSHDDKKNQIIANGNIKDINGKSIGSIYTKYHGDIPIEIVTRNNSGSGKETITQKFSSDGKITFDSKEVRDSYGDLISIDTRKYDSAGRITHSEEMSPETDRVFTENEYKYDAFGNITEHAVETKKMLDDKGEHKVLTKKIVTSQQVDDVGNLISKTESKYNSRDLMVSSEKETFNSDGERITKVVTENSFDSDRDLTCEIKKTFDSNENLIECTQKNHFYHETDRYDGESELTEKFDNNGKMKSSIEKIYDDKGNVTSKVEISQSFDRNGHFIKGQKFTFDNSDNYPNIENIREEITGTENKSFDGNSLACGTDQLAESMSSFSGKEAAPALESHILTGNTNSVPRSLVGVANFASKAPALLIY